MSSPGCTTTATWSNQAWHRNLETVHSSTVRPPSSRYCFGTRAPMRVPLPPAGISTTWRGPPACEAVSRGLPANAVSEACDKAFHPYVHWLRIVDGSYARVVRITASCQLLDYLGFFARSRKIRRSVAPAAGGARSRHLPARHGRFTRPAPAARARRLPAALRFIRRAATGRLVAARRRAVHVIVCAHTTDCVRLIAEIGYFAPTLQVAGLPDWEILPYDHLSPHQDLSPIGSRRCTRC